MRAFLNYGLPKKPCKSLKNVKLGAESVCAEKAFQNDQIFIKTVLLLPENDSNIKGDA